MKKSILDLKSILILAVTLLPILGLCGCGQKPPAQPTAVAVLIGNHANSKRPNVRSSTVESVIYDAIYSFGYVSVISVDGSPSVVTADSYDIDEQYKHASDSLYQSDAAAKTDALVDGIATVAANDSEVDTLEALYLAVQSLNDVPAGTPKTILVLDTGLSTAGLLNFGNNLLGTDAAVIADELEARRAIPDLAGITVRWPQIGNVALPQQKLSHEQIRQLAEIWEAIVTRGGGTFVYDNISPVEEDLGAGLPSVTPIALPAETPIVFSAAHADELNFDAPVFLTDDQVRFVEDSSEYLDPRAATAVLSVVADHMDAHPDLSLLLIGSTAGDDDTASARRLSARRAEAVRGTLVTLGIAEQRIKTLGLGSADPWHIPGVGYDGPLAAQNRKVVLLNAESDMARSLTDR